MILPEIDYLKGIEGQSSTILHQPSSTNSVLLTKRLYNTWIKGMATMIKDKVNS